MRADFYHLTESPLERALPPLLERVFGAGQRAVIMAGSERRLESLSSALWTHRDDSWLPHGAAQDGTPTDQPAWLTTEAENPNGANLLILTDGADVPDEFKSSFARCLDLFDGASEDALNAARKRWVATKKIAGEMHYWQQSEGGGWKEKQL